MQFIAVSVVAGIVGAGLAIPSVGVASIGANNALKVFNALPAQLDERPLAEQSRMLDADGKQIASFYWLNRKEVPLDKISEPMQEATVAIEDYRFFEHGGVDFQGIGRALVHNLVSSSKQGGSTLTQQYVKNVLAENAHADADEEGVQAAKEASGMAGYARKLREAKLAVAVEKKYDKKEILNRYMNINNYSGSPNVYGVEAAAQHYWSIPASKLNHAQAATLAGIVKNPSAFNPERFPENALERRNVVLSRMHQLGKISDKEYEDAKKTDLDLKITKTSNGCMGAGDMGFFCDYVQAYIENNKAFGETKEERRDLLQRGGLTIQTTINPKLQKAAFSSVKKRVPVGDPSGAGHSVVTVEPGTGKVLAMTQNRNYSVTEGKKNTDTAINFNVQKAYNGASGFQVGSTWKPFVLAEWLKEGKSLNTSVSAAKRTFPANSWKYRGCKGYGSNWSPNNAGDSKGNEQMTALAATKNSVNTAYASMANQLNMCGIMKTAESLGIKYGNGQSLETVHEQLGVVEALLPSSVLGIVQVAPIDMANAYSVFAAGGILCTPTPIESIKDGNGKKVKIPDPDCHRALDKDVAQNVSYALSQTFNGGTTSRLKIGAPAGAKTGTTNFEVGSTWLAGFTSQMSTAVWTGDPNGSRDWRRNGKGVVRGRVYGATYSGATWQNYMSQAVKIVSSNKGLGGPVGNSVKEPEKDEESDD